MTELDPKNHGKPLQPVIPTFEEMNRTIYSRDDWFGSWPEKVVATVEANDFEQQALWTAWALDSPHHYYGGLLWRQRNPGTSALLHGELFDTNVSLVVNEIEGHLVLFWYACSQRCDHLLARDWIKRSFPNAVEPSGRRIAWDANNFHNAILGLRSIK